MTPLFKSHHSLNGRSLLKEADVIRLFQESGEDKLVLVEDTFSSFRKISKLCKENDIHFVFGIRLNVVQAHLKDKPSKLIFFAKNNEGVKALRRIYSDAHRNSLQAVKLDRVLKENLLEHVDIAVPFYDSFIYNNLFYFGVSSLNIESLNPIYFEEDNNHPHDYLISKRLRTFAPADKIESVKSIYYEKKDDFKAFQAFKAICNRSAGGRPPSFDAPQVEGLSSCEFCFESFKEK